MINFLIRKGVSARPVRRAGATTTRITRAATAAGRAVRGHSVQCRPSWATGSDKVQPPLAKAYGFVVLTNELRSVQYFNRAPRAFAVATRVFLRQHSGRVIARRQILTNGFVADCSNAQVDDRPQRRRATAVDETPQWTISSSKTAGLSARARRPRRARG